MKHVYIVGAGLLGRLLALRLARGGWRVTLVDRDDQAGTASCAYVGAGMLAPYLELETAEPEICRLGLRSLELWPKVLAGLDDVFFQQAGSLVVAHAADQGELAQLARAIRRKWPQEPEALRTPSADELRKLEPELSTRFTSGLFAPHEGQIDGRGLLPALGTALVRAGVEWRTGVEVDRVGAHSLELAGASHSFDWAIDTRGLGGRPDLPGLRGVRGELIHLHAPGVKLQRPVRLLHPRYPLYVVPRPEGRYLIGATTIESDDASPVSVQSALDMLSAAYSICPGFAEGRVLELAARCRPALPDNLPRLITADGVLRVNGLFRHGYLIAPALVELAVSYLESGDVPEGATDLFVAEAEADSP